MSLTLGRNQVSNSRFAWLYGAPLKGDQLCNRILFERHGVKIVPSLGSIVPGWTLSFPSRPVLNISHLNLSERKLLLDATEQAASSLGIFSKRIFHFEHGSGFQGSVMGCGLDMAHLHTVPLEKDLVSFILSSSDTSVSWTRRRLGPSVWDDVDEEYLLVWENGSSEALLGKCERPVSQYFRKMIAQLVRRPNQWNYRVDPFEDNIRETIEAFQ